MAKATPSKAPERRTALAIASIYVAVSILWIAFSDQLVELFVAGAPPGQPALQELTRLQTLKGWFWVTSTGVMLYVLIGRSVAAVLRAERRADEAREAGDQRLAEHERRVEQERSGLEEQLRQSQKMEAIGRLAGGLAHDFNNVLTAIAGYGELALARVPPGDPLRHDLEGIRRSAERAGGLTRQLLTMSRKQMQQPRPMDLNTVVIDMGRMLPRLLGDDIEVVVLPGAHPGTVRADPGQMEQVLLNLCINARDAMVGGGRLTIETENTERATPPIDEPLGGPSGACVALTVTDTGCGMDAETRRRAFEPFFTTKEAGKGTGLGLATVYGIVSQSGGCITCESEPGHGTSFRIVLPLASAVTAPAEAVNPAPDGGTETVLVVEDDGTVLELARRFLECYGYRVLTARDAVSALELAASHAGPLDLLLADVVLPGVNGPELARRLVAQRPARVLFMSGHADISVLPAEVLDAGAPFLEKPFSAGDLARKVRQVLDGGRPNPASAPRQGTVLVVDDDPQVGDVVRGLLAAAGYEVLQARDGNEALAVLGRSPCDAVLCDMLMPNKEGIETCAELRRRYPGLPVIAMSGAPGGTNYMRIAERLGAVASLSKPFSGSELVAAVSGALGNRRLSAAVRGA